MNLRFPLRYLIPSVLFAFSLALTLTVYFYQLRESQRSIEGALQIRAAQHGTELAGSLEDHYLNQDDKGALLQAGRFAVDADLALMVLADSQNKILYASDFSLVGQTIDAIAGLPPPEVYAKARRTLAGQTYYPQDRTTLWGIYPIRMPPLPGEIRATRISLVYLAFDATRQHAQASSQALRSALAFMLGIAALSLLMWWILRVALTQRVERLVGAMRSHVEQGSSGEALLQGNDEIAELGRHFSDLTRDLSQRNRQLEALNQNLQQEIAVRQETERALQEKELKIRAIYDQTFQFIGLLDCSGILLEANNTALEYSGVARADVIGKPFWDTPWWTHDPALQQWLREAVRRAAAGEPQRAEVTHPAADGTIRHVEFSLKPIRDAAGKVIWLIPEGHDISERKRSEENLRLVASVFDNMRDGVVITDAQNRIIQVNQAFTQVTGYTQEEVVGKNPRILKSGRHDQAFYQALWQSINETGHWQGEIWDRRKNGEIYLELLGISAVRDENGVLTNYVAVCTDINPLKLAQSELEHLAHYDALTGLPNRTLLADRLQQSIAHARRQGSMLAVCFADLDGFKPVNDQYGHEIGDRLLTEVAGRFTHTLRAEDTVARLGGDEFVILLAEIRTQEELEQALARILTEVAAPYMLDGNEMRLSASIGVTVFPHDTGDPDTLLRHADQAMYQAKEHGRNRFHLFDTEESRQAQDRRLELARIERALGNNEFRLHYQPKVNMRSGQVIGVEALIRWQHPERGLLPPLQFLPQAEQSELIVEIGEWVLHQALLQASAWRKQGLDLPVSVNVAARQLQRPDFIERLHQCLAAVPDVPASFLELEILESVALEDMERVRAVIEACRALGISFALDDFGTGYSSLAYLKRLPADTLKIDQTFIRDMLQDAEDMALVEGVVGLAAAFQRGVIAEGVETIEHGVVLLRLGCDLAQGYGIARPMPAEAVAEWVRQFKPSPEWLAWADVHWQREDFPLLVAQYDHVHWVNRIIATVEGESLRLGHAELTDHHHCRFGRWYYAHGQSRYGHMTEFATLEDIHARVHQVGPEIIRLCQAGERDAARALVPELLSLKAQILDKLTTLQRVVASYH